MTKPRAGAENAADGHAPARRAPVRRVASVRREPARRAPRAADSVERAYNAIRKMVVDFHLRPDQRINEMQLARQLNLSRTPVREALNRLASEGFLVLRPNLGFFFRALETDDLVQLFELRTIVETGGLALACERADDEAITSVEAFWKMAQQRYRDHDADEILSLDESFHVKLMELSGNQELVRTLIGINARIRFIRRVQISLGKYHPKLIDEHTRLLEAVRARDSQRCAELLRDHIDMTFEDARAALKEALFHAYMSDTQAVQNNTGA